MIGSRRGKVLLGALALCTSAPYAESDDIPWPGHMRVVVEEARPLEHSRGKRLGLFLWPAMNPGRIDEKTAERFVRALDERGIGLICSWNPSPERREESLEAALPVAGVQTRLGLRVNVNANSCLYSFFNGDPKTAHVDESGQPFWDESFGKGRKMGCPFAIEHREADIRRRVEYFVNGYKQAGVDLNFVFADWEIDGPLEVNRAQEASMRCTRCRSMIENLDDFTVFQRVMRERRSALQRRNYAEPILAKYPKALVGNYAIYPNNGLRYWYDYFEYFVEGRPHVADQRAKYRRWYNDFPETGYTFAMPVVYTWYPTYGWYDFEDTDYRWFYNMLLVASNAGQHTSADVPIISFVHWHTTAPPEDADPAVRQFSEEKYQELLWHMLLRGTDTFFLWCPGEESAKEIRLLHPVYAAAQEYGDFLENGVPVNFWVSNRPGPVVSALRLGDRLLVRRTEFGGQSGPVDLRVGTKTISVSAAPGVCRILTIR